jgi:molecular chaperone IbpA
MNYLARYTASDLPALMDRISRNSIGVDEYLDRVFNLQEANTNYPPYNLIQVSNVESRLEIALAGFSNDDVKVYTEYGKLYIEGKKRNKESDLQYLHKGVAQRDFTRAWSLSDDTEVRDVKFEDGLLVITLGKIVPEHYARKEYL